MKLILKNFRSHLDYEVEFKDGMVHFLKGDSGTGKSTIFQAIIWALYGKEQLVCNHDHPTQKMWVILHIEDMIIYRQKYPCAVKVTFRDVEYLNDIAEDMIVQQFGELDVWMASSYLMQSKGHPFLEFSRKNRMKLLNHIAFGGEDPTPRLLKIDEVIKNCEKELAAKQPIYDQDLKAFNTTIAEQNINMKDRIDIPPVIMEVEILTQKISMAQCEIKELKFNVARHQTLQKQHQSLTARLNKITNAYPNLSLEHLNALKARREKYLDKTKRLNDVQKIVQTFKALTSKIGTNPPQYQLRDVEEAKKQAALFEENLSLAKSLGIVYTTLARNSEIVKLETSLSCQWMFSVHRQAQELNTRIQNYKHINSKLSFVDVKFMTANINAQWMFDSHAAADRLRGIISSIQEDNESLSSIPLTSTDLQFAERSLEMQWVFNAKRCRDQLTQELSAKMELLKHYPTVSFDAFNNLKKVLKSQSIYQRIDQRDQLKKQLMGLDIDPMVTPQTLQSLREELTDLERTKNLEHCPSCSVALSVVRGKIIKYSGHFYNDDDAENLRNKIDRCVRILENQKDALYIQRQINTLEVEVPDGIYRIDNIADHQAKIDQCEKFFALDQEIKRLETEISKINLPDVDVTEIVDLNAHRAHVDKCKKYLENVRSMNLYQHELSKMNLPEIPTGFFKIQDLEIYQKHIDQGEQYLKNQDTIKILELEASKNSLPIIPEGVLELTDQEAMKRRLEELKKIVVVQPLQTSVEIMEQAIQWHHLNNQISDENFQKTLSDPVGDEILQEVIDDATGALAQMFLLQQQIKETSDHLDSFTSFDHTDIEKEQNDLDNMITLKSCLEMKIEASKRAEGAANIFTALLERSNQLDFLKQRLVDLQEFKALCKEAESAALSKLLESLNVFINSVAYKLFDDPIHIRISTMAVQKKKIRGAIIEKQHAHIDIHYKGGKFPDAKLLSGGEYERICLLLSLAFNRVVGSNLLILDEATASLDGERKDDCFETIRQCMANKTIIMTNHEGHVGYYDNIVELKR